MLLAIVSMLLIKTPLASAGVIDTLDWAGVPYLGDKLSLRNYLHEREKLLQPNIQVLLPIELANSLLKDPMQYMDMMLLAYNGTITTRNDDSTARVLFTMRYYPGARVAYAYTHNDTSFLLPDELQLYNAAVGIVNSANTKPTLLQKELYIHDVIAARADYYVGSSAEDIAGWSRNKSALGAILDGRANCQGYADAFYMLGKMCGFNVDKIVGFAGGDNGSVKHVWNSINFNGSDYCVDVTWDDGQADERYYTKYAYFNAPAEVVELTHDWTREYAPNVRQNIDGLYFYYTREFETSGGNFFGAHSANARDALGWAAQRMATENREWTYVMCPYDPYYADVNHAVEYISSCLINNHNYSCSYFVTLKTLGDKYLYYTIHLD